MFELIHSLAIDTSRARAQGRAKVPSDHPLFADHFPGSPLMPGSLLVELAAQVAGPLAEEMVKSRLNVDRWAVLGMIRNAKFVRPVTLPVDLRFTAQVQRFDTSTIGIYVESFVDDSLAMSSELVMMMMETKAEWEPAIRARDHRIASWKE